MQEYLKLPYNVIIQRVNDESGEYYHATVLELPGCQSTGDTYEEAYQEIWEAVEGWIETKSAAGFEIPLPLLPEKYSGKFTLRIPKSLHQKLSMEAVEEGVSLNQYAIYKLSR